MKKIFILSLLMFGASSMYAQEAENNGIPQSKTYTYKLKNALNDVDNYGHVLYYGNGAQIFNLRNNPLLDEQKNIIEFKINPNGSSYVIITENKGKTEATIFDLWVENRKMESVKKLPAMPQTACYNSNGRSLLLAANDGNIYEVNAVTAKLVGATNINTPAKKIVMSGNDNVLAAVNDNGVDVWNWQDRVLRKTISAANVRQVTFSQDNQSMAILTADGKLSIYSTRDLKETQTIEALGNAVDCSFHPVGKHMAVVTGDSRISIINLKKTNDREYADSDNPGIIFTKFANNTAGEGVYLLYGAEGLITYKTMDHLSPLNSKLIADELSYRMDEWARQLPNESDEEYRLRVNDATRAEKMKSLELEITNSMATNVLGTLASMTLGGYNAAQGLLSLGFENMPDMLFSVPQDEVGAFMTLDNVELQNVQYGLNAEDEFVLLHADIFNKETGKVYSWDNENAPEMLSFADDATAFTPLEVLQQTAMEENTLADIKQTIVEEAKDQNLISDHTHIAVKTHVQPSTDANGNNILNYEVSVSYTVEQEFSAKEDYAGGKYKIEESNAGMAMLTILKKAFENDFAKYMVDGKRLRIKISGAADATPISRVIKYDGCYGEFTMEPIYLKGNLTNVTVTKASGITENPQLAFLRAVGVKDFLFREVEAINKMKTDVVYDINVTEERGSEHRKVSVALTFEDAF